MENIENQILIWCIKNIPEAESIISPLIDKLKVTEREFSGGNGVFVSFENTDNNVSYPCEKYPGPWIESPQLECGASTFIHVTDKNKIDCIEIWAHAGDYPSESHVSNFKLVNPGPVNYIDATS